MAGNKKGGLAYFLYGTLKGKAIVNYCMSGGAAVVILGALFKIQHYPGASIMLIIGLCTEAALFLLGALEPQHLHLDWAKVYPELAHAEEDEKFEDEIDDEYEEEGVEEEVAEVEAPQVVKRAAESDYSVAGQLDNMLEQSKIGPELIDSLGKGLQGLADQTEKLTELSDATAATQEYVDSIRSASRSVGSLTDTYMRASDALVALADENKGGHSFGEQLAKMSQNLSDLNSAYEMQLQGANETLENSKTYFGGMDELMSSLNESVQDAKEYREKMGELSQNINSLNTIYGNMLTAMNPNRG